MTQEEKGSAIPGVAVVLLAAVVIFVTARLLLGGPDAGTKPTRVDPMARPEPPQQAKIEALRAKKSPNAKVRPPRPAIEPRRDPEAAARHRGQLRARLVASPPAPNPTVEPDAPLGTLDPEYVRVAIREQFVPIIRECYESAREDHPALAGTIVLSFDILGAKEVAGVADEVSIDEEKSDIENPALRECMVESLYAIDLPAPEGDGKVHVNYPFMFRDQ